MLKVGIIGCGGIANGKHMPSLKQIPELEMVAFCDIIVERAEKAAKEFGTPDAKVYEDYKELLADASIDVVHVLTPNREHAQITIDALHAGKHVMCEKPMAKSAADARRMVEAAKETGKKLTIGYQSRHTEAADYLKKAITRGDLGEIYFAEALAVRRRGTPTWGVFLNEEEQGGGPLIDIGTHSLDLTLYLMDNYKPKMVVGTTYKKLPNPDNGNPWGPWDAEKNTVEDSAFGFIVMENGATIILKSSWALNVIEPCDAASTVLCGTKAGAQIKQGELSLNKDDLGKTVNIYPQLAAGGVAFFDGVERTPQYMEARRFYDSILNDTELITKPEQACMVSELLEAIYVSAKTGKPVYFKDGRPVEDA